MLYTHQIFDQNLPTIGFTKEIKTQMSFFHSKPKGPNTDKMQIDLRVMEAEARQPYNKSIKEIQTNFNLLSSYIRRVDKDGLYRIAHTIAKSKRTNKAYERIINAVKNVRDNVKELANAVVQKQPIPQQLIQDVRILATVPDVVKAQSFIKFRSTFLVQMYGKREVQNLSDYTKVDDDIKFGLYDDCINDNELTAVFVEYVQNFPNFQIDLENILGFPLSQMPDVNPNVSMSPFDTKQLFVLPNNIPDIPRERWAQISQSI